MKKHPIKLLVMVALAVAVAAAFYVYYARGNRAEINLSKDYRSGSWSKSLSITTKENVDVDFDVSDWGRLSAVVVSCNGEVLYEDGDLDTSATGLLIKGLNFTKEGKYVFEVIGTTKAQPKLASEGVRGHTYYLQLIVG